MTEDAKQEGIVPSCGLDFLANGYRSRMGADDVDREAAKNREVFRSVVLSAAVAVLVEDDVEQPVQLVLDGPMTAHDAQQFFGRNVFGEQIIVDEGLLGAAAMGASARGDTGHRRAPSNAVHNPP